VGAIVMEGALDSTSAWLARFFSLLGTRIEHSSPSERPTRRFKGS
jgi:hypothetical protein